LGCLGWCLPALGPFVATRSESPGQGLRAVLQFNAGRLVGYILVLSAALALGSALEGAPWLRTASAAALIGLGILMLLHAVRVNFPDARICRVKAFGRLVDRFPLAAGFLTGVSPCPPLLLAAAAIVGIGPARGLLFGAAFFLGTSLYLLPLAVLGHRRIRPAVSSVAQVAAVFAGLWFIAHGAVLLRTVG
jgi:sulfite exporter TauE/SafE